MSATYANTKEAIKDANTHRFLRVQQEDPQFHHFLEIIPSSLKDLNGHEQIIKYQDLRVSVFSLFFVGLAAIPTPGDLGVCVGIPGVPLWFGLMVVVRKLGCWLVGSVCPPHELFN